jgi:hypothetical protein
VGRGPAGAGVFGTDAGSEVGEGAGGATGGIGAAPACEAPGGI